MIQIYFDTATYDEIERDVKVTINAQLGLIGGTMGLLTGFSILSAVEIIYYLAKLFMSLNYLELRRNQLDFKSVIFLCKNSTHSS